MTREVRPSTPQDAPGIVALLAEAGLECTATPADLRWKYWQPHAGSAGERSWVLADGNQLYAHAGIIRRACVWESGRLDIIHMIDWAARPRDAGAGMVLMKHFGQQVGGLIAIGGSAATVQILPHIGFRMLGSVTGYVRTLFPLRLLRRGEPRNWKLLPRVARSVLWKLLAPAAETRGWRTRRLTTAEVDQVAAVAPVPVRGGTTLERNLGLFRDILTCPVLPTALYTLERAGTVQGYFLLASAPGQVRIADCWVDSTDAADWRALILCAVAQALQDPQAAEVVIWASDPLLHEVLPGCGFHARSIMPIQLRLSPGAQTPPVPIRVQMLDNDAVYLHEGNESWA